ncbi:unnamed protein product [Ixodes pacificus]
MPKWRKEGCINSTNINFSVLKIPFSKSRRATLAVRHSSGTKRVSGSEFTANADAAFVSITAFVVTQWPTRIIATPSTRWHALLKSVCCESLLLTGRDYFPRNISKHSSSGFKTLYTDITAVIDVQGDCCVRSARLS